VLREYRQAIEDAETRLERLTRQVGPSWSPGGRWRRSWRRTKPCAGWPS
jgi:hypothetical protein